MSDFDWRHCDIPLLGIVAGSGTGKTTLLEQALPRLRARGLRVAVIKHSHHDLELDVPGKDSYRLRKAGGTPVIVASARRMAVMLETPDGEVDDLDLPLLLQYARVSQPDLILIEGFKDWPLPRLELFRPEVGKPLRAGTDEWVQAVATNLPAGACVLPPGMEHLPLDDLSGMVDWLAAWPQRWRQRVRSL